MHEKPARSESDVRSRSSMCNLRNFLSKGFNYAKNLGMISENPVTDVMTPQGAQARETYAYSLDEVSQMQKVPVVVAALDAHKSRNGYNEWVFHGETGQPLRLDNYAKRVIGPTLKKIG